MSNQDIRENIARLQATIAANIWNVGYVANCENQISSYKDLLESDG
ncbi:MAG: hypothetical protein GXP14_08540 [Gammaproteobacteria bacterium]|nr:hypothetical protein [Gammaproteobacteria bacterium]